MHLILKHQVGAPWVVLGGNRPALATLGFGEARHGIVSIDKPTHAVPAHAVVEWNEPMKRWLHYTHSEWGTTLDRYGSLRDAVFYPILKWQGLSVINDGWAWDCKNGTVLKIFATYERLESICNLHRRINAGTHPLNIAETDRKAPLREWEEILPRLVARGFKPWREQYETTPRQVYGELTLDELELVEGPCPIPLPPEAI